MEPDDELPVPPQAIVHAALPDAAGRRAGLRAGASGCDLHRPSGERLRATRSRARWTWSFASSTPRPRAAQLYSEQHLGVALDDATGGFSVQLGLGTSPVGTFDAALFADVDRWMEVVVDSEVLTPRPIIASVPWALVAQQANGIVPDPKTIVVDCDAGDVLQDAIDAAGPKSDPSGRRARAMRISVSIRGNRA